MEIEKLTEKMREALNFSRKEALSEGSPEVTAMHLFKCISEQVGGIAEPLFHKLEISLDQIKAITNKFLSSGSKVKGLNQDPVISSELVSVLNHADQMKLTMGDNYLSVEHVLIAFAEIETAVLNLYKELDLKQELILFVTL